MQSKLRQSFQFQVFQLHSLKNFRMPLQNMKRQMICSELRNIRLHYTLGLSWAIGSILLITHERDERFVNSH